MVFDGHGGHVEEDDEHDGDVKFLVLSELVEEHLECKLCRKMVVSDSVRKVINYNYSLFNVVV